MILIRLPRLTPAVVPVAPPPTTVPVEPDTDKPLPATPMPGVEPLPGEGPCRRPGPCTNPPPAAPPSEP